MIMVPFDRREGSIWIDGTLKPWEDATVHILTHGMHYASTVFEGERVYGGKIFKLTEHSERLHQSARLLGFTIPYSVSDINDKCMQVIKENGIEDGYVRPVAWRGSEMMAISAQKTTIHLAIASWSWGNYFTDKMRGIRLATSKWRRPAPNMAPVHSKAAGLYMICTLAKHQAEDDGFDDALMLDYRGYLAESTGANLFLVIDGALHTPIADCFLDGITRQSIIALAKESGIEVVERHIPPEDLKKASEVVLTGTAAEITPIREIEGILFTPGPVTQTLMEGFDLLVRR
jgi:branched-chain amino acid aminotransferase